MGTDPSADVKRRAIAFAAARGLHLGRQLGSGKDGTVYLTIPPSGDPTAIKAFGREEAFQRELACYFRLRERGIGGDKRVCGHSVPVLLHHEVELRIIEMTVVDRPFVLDFASAYLDTPPDFPAEVWSERELCWSENFEEDWPKARQIVHALRALGIYLLDPSPSNIGFARRSE